MSQLTHRSLSHTKPVQSRLVEWSLMSVGLFATIGCEGVLRSDDHQPTTRALVMLNAQHREPIEPLPTELISMDGKSRLGKLLFHDKRLSHDNTISCASCHDLSNGGDDGRPYSVGIGGAVGGMNAPTVLNAALNLAQFWDGRAPTLEAQVAGPIHATNEMGSNWNEIIAKLTADPDVKQQFDQLFRDGISADSISECIANYEKLLLTPNAPFDRYLRGDTGAVSAEVVEGYRLFRDLGCAACHQGRAIGGNLFEKFGVMQSFMEHDGGTQANAEDAAHMKPSLVKFDDRRLKVPTLRNVELTAPYLHDGSAETLEEAVQVMSTYQLGAELTAEELRLLVIFLRSLTGVLSEELK